MLKSNKHVISHNILIDIYNKIAKLYHSTEKKNNIYATEHQLTVITVIKYQQTELNNRNLIHRKLLLKVSSGY